MGKVSYKEMLHHQPLSNFFGQSAPPIEADSTSSERAFTDEERVKSLDSFREKVKELLADGLEHSIEEIREVGGSNGDRRVRELRTEKFGGLNIEVTRVSGKDSFVYRWVK